MRTHGITIRLGPELKQRLHNAARKFDLSENDIARHAVPTAIDWLEANDYTVGHYGEFYWWGRAENAWHARAKDWAAWLEQRERRAA
jgi:predicted transcriptional regulator